MLTDRLIRGMIATILLATTAMAGPIRSDDFSSTTLNTNLWTIVNPLGDGSFVMTGTQLALTVPAGPHIVNGVANNSIRAMQAIDNSNFGIEMKFESPVAAPTGTIVMQGVLVQESTTRFMRIGFDSVGTSTRLYACYFNSGSSTPLIAKTIYTSPTQPLYLRLQRASSKWTITHSANGSTWVSDGSFKAPMTVGSVGPFVGSQGTGVPAFTGIFDYVFNTSTPISPEDSKTLTVNAIGSGSVLASPTLSSYPIGTTVTLTAQPAINWGFDHWSGEAGGTTNPARIVINANKNITATFAEFISGSAVQPGRGSAVVSWTTDRPASSRVDYGLTSAFELGTVRDDTLTTLHSLTISNLADATAYLCRITSTAATGNGAQSAALPFTTTSAQEYLLTVNADGGGTVTLSPNLAAYPLGTSVTLTATANPGWRFSGWSGGVSGTANPATITVTTNTTVSALFEQFTIAIDSVNLTTNSAQIVWSTNFPSTGVVDFGLTTGYEIGQVACGDLGLQHTATLSGIDTSQTHHYRIVATGEGGGTAASGDQTFVMQQPGAIISDDFSHASLNPFWTFVNPLGDGSYALTGTQLTISVPQGTSHDVWSSGIDAPRMMQLIGNGDFSAEIKFESVPASKYQMQGILAEQDATHHIRFDFYSDGSRLYAYAAYITNTSAVTRIQKVITASNPIWMHVTRSGDNWLMEYSADGTNWSSAGLFTQAFTAAAIGPFAGNFSGPANTAVIDYFFNDASPIVPEDGAGLGLTVNISGQGSVARNPEKASYTLGETVQVTATAAPSWRFTEWTGDTTGTLNPVTVAVMRDWVMTANFQQFIIDPHASAQENAATVTWTTPLAATSRVDYGLTTDYGNSAEDAALATTHSLALTALSANTLYHYKITSTAGGISTSSADMTFSTGSASGIVSDDFFGTTLKPMWTFVNPLSDSTLTMTGTQAQIAVPPGYHELWTSGMNAPRLEQPAANTDFEIEAKFESSQSTAYQEMGVFAKESSNKFLRIEFYHDGTRTHLYAVALLNGSPTTFFDKAISSGNPQFLRLKRAGDTWTVSYQTESAGWTDGGSFTYAMVVTAVGPYAGNYGAAYTALIDYFFNTDSPISPEDNSSYSLTVNVSGNGTVTKNPNQSSYMAGDVVTLTAVPGNSATQFAGWSGALTGSANPAQLTIQGNATVTANFTSSNATAFNMWYGDTQRFGHIGKPQVWIDVLGTVSDGDGIASLSYSLNGGASKPLSVGSDNRRLQGAGDFDVQLAFTELAPGTNTIVLRAVDALSNVTTKTVTVNYIDGVIPSPNMSVQWTTTTVVTDVMQPVDGKWMAGASGAQNISIGYDRLLDIGDMSWTDYEITVPITVSSWDPAGIGGINGTPGMGFIIRWNGHTNDPAVATQPLSGWNPFGNCVWYDWDATGGKSGTFEQGNLNDSSGQVLQLNVPYMFKARVETIPGVGTLYSKKVWPKGGTEPATWTKQAYGATSVEHGSILFIAHWVQMTVGDITIQSLVAPFSSISVNAATNQAAISWQSSQPRTSVVEYGLSTSYELGRVTDAVLRTSHTLSLGGLAQGTLYHYRISGAASDGTTATTADMTFSTSSAQTIRSDNFNTTTLNTALWTFINPVGDATLTMNGSEARISLPAGTDHDAWTAGNRTGRLMQACPDGDFQIEAKFNSSLTATYQFHGLIVEQDATHYIRFDTVRSGGSVYAYCAQLSGTSVSTKVNRAITSATPMYLRVGRSGSAWTYDYSTDGTTWTRAVSFDAALTVTKAGVMAGNAEGKTSPAYTGVIDYFKNLADPINN